MNLISKAWCRIFQFSFRAAIPFLPYREPRIFPSIEALAPYLTQLQADGALLVTDGFLHSSGATSPIETVLKNCGIRCVVYDGTRPNPTVQNVEEALQLYRRENCKLLIAFGGGSAMDCAKAVGARVAYPKRTLDQMKGNLRVWKKLPTLIAIPTTAGTGSEVTVTAVITDSEKKHKYTMNNFTFIPTCAVHDPAVTRTLPPHLTATTGMDALTHAVESYIGRSTTAQTRALALEATRLVFDNIETAYRDGNDLTARKNMLRAAYTAGIAFSKSYVGYIHAVAHSLGGQYNVPHGLANSVLMPYVLESYGACIHKKLHELAIAAGISDESESHALGARKFITAIRVKNAVLGIPDKLDGIRPEDIPTMAKHAAKEANPLYPVPKLLDTKALEQFYYMVRSESNEH